MNPQDQQWLTARSASAADLTVDDIWAHYVELGGSAKTVAVAAYLHGSVLLDVLHRDLVSFAVNELIEERPMPGRAPQHLVSSSISSPAFRAPFSDQPGGSSSPGSSPAHSSRPLPPAPSGPARWPLLRTRLEQMFDPADAEAHRIASLTATGLTGTVREERFDRIARLTRNTFGVSFAAITLIESERQVIKALAGPPEVTLPKIMARAESFCSHTIEDDRILTVPDTMSDERFAASPLVAGEPGIRFYTGHPLTGPGGWRIGALCIMHTEPREFSESDKRQLRILSAAAQLELHVI